MMINLALPVLKDLTADLYPKVYLPDLITKPNLALMLSLLFDFGAY